MNRGKRLASALYALVGLALCLLGARYLLAATLMPYHLAVIQAPWSGLDGPYQTLSLGLLKGFGAGALCVGLTIFLLTLHAFRSAGNWVFAPLALLALGYSALLLHVTHFALLPGARPVVISGALCVLSAIAAIASLLGRDADSTRAQTGAESL